MHAHLQEHLGGRSTATPESQRRQGGVTKPPEGQPDTTKDLSRGVSWANFHILFIDAYSYFQCVRQRTSTGVELFGTLIVSMSALVITGIVRFIADDFVLPALMRRRGAEMPKDGFHMFPSWEVKVFETVSSYLCVYMYVCVCIYIYI